MIALQPGLTQIVLHCSWWMNKRFCYSLCIQLTAFLSRPLNVAKNPVYSIFILTSTSLSLCSREAASSSFFSSKACPSSAAKIRSVSIPPPLSLLPGEDADEGRANERETEEDEERGKKESSRLGEGRLFFLGVNIVDRLVGVSWKASSQVLVLAIRTHTGGTAVNFCQIQNPFLCLYDPVWSGL